MTEDGAAPPQWSLCQKDHELLRLLAEVLWRLRTLARRGHDLIAIGEALQAIECLREGEGEEVEVDVGFEIGFRRGDRAFEEGLFVCFRINDEEIILDELHTTYSSDEGSDHFTVAHARLSPHGRFDESGVNKWLEAFRWMVAQDDVVLLANRDHV